ncbi:dipicolinate synthase subunit DpsA [Candidatus Desulforudis audaxviator]|uniref:Alanine dehydrogenase/PNT domain protein n=1 Tax=Desulforudis audaxviator (strain MP104C) TaxID=477974 RepID=B1I380_DESAP|nr:dipicolinate synthase subunit DpsA [Candidatus Desulforudis audaxviator]ACA59456.1 alanine dehydrogenase/PNT domain protein [Candidatus Desulforudis audaxviator MP104C]AZK59438.1 Dipicolinate synthase subunit A [Candidatus Desulforudis audaxviator]
MLPLVGLRISVLGGDGRGVYIVQEFAAMGARVKALGIPVLENAPEVLVCNDPAQALADIDVLVVPLPGLDRDGRLHTVTGESPVITREMLETVGTDVPIFTVVAKEYLTRLAAELGLQIIELAEFQEFAILNSIPSAEGAVQLAMEKMPATIHGSQVVVLGFGNLGMTLARMLDALGAKTTVMARNPAALARAYEMGFGTVLPERLADQLALADLIFNTVPAPILDKKILKSVNPEACIIDLASAPGGTDFTVARALGLNASLAPNLPGKVAPKSAGRIIARTIQRLLHGTVLKGTSVHKGVLAGAAHGR